MGDRQIGGSVSQTPPEVTGLDQTEKSKPLLLPGSYTAWKLPHLPLNSLSTIWWTGHYESFAGLTSAGLVGSEC